MDDVIGGLRERIAEARADRQRFAARWLAVLERFCAQNGSGTGGKC
jgi:hypothetical protein